MEDLFKRRGKIFISEELIKEEPEVVMEIMGKMIITEVERKSFPKGSLKNKLIYYGFSPEFDICGDGSFPVYDVTITENERGFNIEIY